MQNAAEQFREKAAARKDGRRSPGRYPQELRELALRHLAEVLQQGGRATDAARQLGVDANTIRVWEKRARGAVRNGGPLLPVDIAGAADVTAVFYVVVGPHGLRVDCRSPEAVVALFRAIA